MTLVITTAWGSKATQPIPDEEPERFVRYYATALAAAFTLEHLAKTEWTIECS